MMYNFENKPTYLVNKIHIRLIFSGLNKITNTVFTEPSCYKRTKLLKFDIVKTSFSAAWKF